MAGYPHTAQKCLWGSVDGGTAAVMYEGVLRASGGYGEGEGQGEGHDETSAVSRRADTFKSSEESVG